MSFTDVIAQAQSRLSAPRMYVDDHTNEDIRVIAAFLDLFDTTEGPAVADLEFVDELRGRRARASLAAGGRDAGRAAAAEATTVEDIDRLNAMVRERGTLVLHLTSTHADVTTDFRTGARCSVCALTTAQAAATGYNCTEEC